MAKGHPSQRGTGRAGDEHPDDAFVARTLEFSQWAKQNTTVLVILGLLLVLVVGVSLYWVEYRQQTTQRAVLQLEQIQQSVGTGNVEAAKVQLIEYVERFGNTPYGHEARLLLGQLHLETGQPADAVEVLEPAAEDLDEPIGVQAALLLGKAYEQQGMWQEGEELYLRVADEAELGFQRVTALDDAARIRAMEGDAGGAAELYRRILDEEMEEGADERGEYEMRLQEALTEANG